MKKTDPPPAPKKPKNPFEHVRMLGARDEALEVRLTDAEMDDAHHQFLALHNQREELEEKLSEVKSNYKAQFEAIDLQSQATRRLLNSRRRVTTVNVQEWLNASNEVVRIRTDTGDQLGDARKARSDELQEKLFPDKPDAAVDPGTLQGDIGPDGADAAFGDEPA